MPTPTISNNLFRHGPETGLAECRGLSIDSSRSPFLVFAFQHEPGMQRKLLGFNIGVPID